MPSPEQEKLIEQLNLDENEKIRTEIMKAYLDDETKGANLIVQFATEKGIAITADEVAEYMDNLEDDFDFEVPLELLTSVSGGKSCADGQY